MLALIEVVLPMDTHSAPCLQVVERACPELACSRGADELVYSCRTCHRRGVIQTESKSRCMSRLASATAHRLLSTVPRGPSRLQVAGDGGQMANVARIYNDNVGVVSNLSRHSAAFHDHSLWHFRVSTACG